ncbi:nitrogen fixation uncharacterized protein [Pseudoduganella flava]|nr:Nif11 family protein [Pseudoduganella flava]TWI45270.1 nitrogen fixation uncharacterized protein [Pseudoduganella flava]
MSIAAAQRFRRQVEASPALQAEVAKYLELGEIDFVALAAIAARHGVTLTPNEARLLADAADLK